MSRSKPFDPSLEFFGVASPDVNTSSFVDDDDDISDQELQFAMKDPDTIDLQNMSANLKLFQKDPVVMEALTTTIDLTNYYNTVQTQQNALERECIDDYIKNADNLAEIYEKLDLCENRLNGIYDIISTFQEDLSSVSDRIRGLQKRSSVMGVELENRTHIIDTVSQFTAKVYVSPDLVNLVSSAGGIDGPFAGACGIVFKRMIYFNVYKFALMQDFVTLSKLLLSCHGSSNGSRSPSLLTQQIQMQLQDRFADAQPIYFVEQCASAIQSVNIKACSKALRGLLAFIASLEKPLTNIPFKQNLGLAYKPIFELLLYNQLVNPLFPSVEEFVTPQFVSNSKVRGFAKEVVQTYKNSISTLYTAQFQELLTTSMKLREDSSMTMSDVLGAPPPAKKSGFVTFFTKTLTGQSNVPHTPTSANGAYNPFILGPREALLVPLDHSLIAHISTSKVQQNQVINSVSMQNSHAQHPFEKLMSSALVTLVDTLIQEASFVNNFFGLSSTVKPTSVNSNADKLLSDMLNQHRTSPLATTKKNPTLGPLSRYLTELDCLSATVCNEVMYFPVKLQLESEAELVAVKGGKEFWMSTPGKSSENNNHNHNNNSSSGLSSALANTLTKTGRSITSSITSGISSAVNKTVNNPITNTLLNRNTVSSGATNYRAFHPLSILSAIFQPVFKQFYTLIEEYTNKSADSLSILVLIRCIEGLLAHAHSHKAISFDIFAERTTLLLWNRFKEIFDTNLVSVQRVLKMPKTADKVQPFVIRYAEYQSSVRRLNVYTSTSLQHLCCVQQFHEVRGVLDILSDGFSDKQERQVFLVNQYDAILKTVIVRGFFAGNNGSTTEGGVESVFEYTQFHALQCTAEEQYIENSINKLYPKFTSFIKGAEAELKKNPSISLGQTSGDVSFTESSLERLAADFNSSWSDNLQQLLAQARKYFVTVEEAVQLSPSLFAAAALGGKQAQRLPSTPSAQPAPTHIVTAPLPPPTSDADLPADVAQCLAPLGYDLGKRSVLQLALYYKRFVEIANTVCGRRQPVFMRELVPVASVMTEIKKYTTLQQQSK